MVFLPHIQDSISKAVAGSLKKVTLTIALFFSLTVTAQDFKVTVELDSFTDKTKIKLYSVKSYDQMTNLKVEDFVARGIRKDGQGPWVFSGKVNDSSSLYRLHIGNYKDEETHMYAQTTTFLSLKKGDSVSLRFPDSHEFFDYQVSHSAVNNSLQKVYQINYRLWKLRTLLDTVQGANKQKALLEKQALLLKKEKVLDTIAHADAFYVLINPEIQDHLKNLLFFKNNQAYSSKIEDQFQSALFSQQISRDLELIKPETASLPYRYLIGGIVFLLLLIPFYIIKRKPNRLASLSPTERLIIQLISEGKSNKEIAGIKFTEVSTVKKQVSSIYKKLKVQNRTEAIIYFEKYKK